LSKWEKGDKEHMQAFHRLLACGDQPMMIHEFQRAVQSPDYTAEQRAVLIAALLQ
jgi:hypothetical protein